MAAFARTLFEEVLLDILANILCAAVPLLAAFLLYWARVRRKLRRFFGISNDRSGTVQIRLSTLHVKPGGTHGPMAIRTGLVGPAIIAGEYQFAIDLVGSIQSRPLARVLHVLGETFGVAAIDPPVLCRIDRSLDYFTSADSSGGDSPAPVVFATDNALIARIHQNLAEHSSFVLVGSPVYNVLTYYVLSHNDDEAHADFVESSQEPGHQASAVRIRNFHQAGLDHILPRKVIDLGDGRLLYEEYFILQKIANWNRTGTTIFICAGNSVAATAAALAKLSNWRRFADEFGMGSFTTVYQLHTGDRELTGTTTAAALGTAARVWVWPPEN